MRAGNADDSGTDDGDLSAIDFHNVDDLEMSGTPARGFPGALATDLDLSIGIMRLAQAIS
ncbi:MAG: hypothetical protein JO196_02555 [Hyphomicrobiales bacterium]|nr:hypothetical protein [Hyphomicrobiales bacterium]